MEGLLTGDGGAGSNSDGALAKLLFDPTEDELPSENNTLGSTVFPAPGCGPFLVVDRAAGEGDVASNNNSSAESRSAADMAGDPGGLMFTPPMAASMEETELDDFFKPRPLRAELFVSFFSGLLGLLFATSNEASVLAALTCSLSAIARMSRGVGPLFLAVFFLGLLLGL